MSPEQAQGKVTDARSDLFSLGAVLYFMAAGKPPFTAPHAMAVLNKICKEPLVDVREHNPTVPSGLANLIHTLLEKNCEYRFRSATRAHQILTDYLAYLQQPTANKKPVVPCPKSMKPRFSFKKIGLISAASTLAAVCCSWIIFQIAWPGDPPGKVDEDPTLTNEMTNDQGDSDQAFTEKVQAIEQGINRLSSKPAPTNLSPGSVPSDMDSDLENLRRSIERLENDVDF